MSVAMMKRTAVTVPANDSIPLFAIGRYCFVETGDSSNSITARVMSRSGALIADAMPIVTGASFDWGDAAERLVLSNSTGGAIQVTLWTGDGLGTLNLQSSTVSIDAPATYDSQADVTLAAGANFDIAADAGVRELMFEGDATNTGDLRIRDQAALTDEGKKLKPGETVFLNVRGALRVVNNTAAAQTFAWAKIKA